MRLERLALLAGLGLFLWLLHHIGLNTVAHNLGQIRWGFAAVLSLEGVVVLLTTLGWRRTSPALRRVRYRSLLAMRLTGDGVNALAPAAVGAGELVRASLLARYVPGAQALSSVGLAAMTQFLAQALFVGIGATVARGGGLQPRLRVFGLALLAFLVVFLAILERTSRRREGPLLRLGSLLDRVGRFLAGRAPREGFWRDLESQVFGAVCERPGDLAVSVLFFLGGWCISVVEVGLILRFLGAPAPVGTAFSIAVFAVFIEGAFFFVPARVGVQEGGLYAIFFALGLDPATGFSLGLVRHLRELVWGLVGLTILGLYRHPRLPIVTQERSELLDASPVARPPS